MLAFPPAKLNLGLSITGRRPDGYHDLESVFCAVTLTDVLEIVPASETRLIATGIPVPGFAEENLCLRAHRLLTEDFPDLPPVEIHLHKNIPAGAGLGGGSSDGAAMLRLLDRRFALGIGASAMRRYALSLGSDCPFFLEDGPRAVSGRGEGSRPLPAPLPPFEVVILHEPIHLSTAWAFSRIRPARPTLLPAEAVMADPADWHRTLVNDFEGPVFAAHPVLADLRQSLYAAGALYASLTGSGSAVYGLFRPGMRRNPDVPATTRIFHAAIVP